MRKTLNVELLKEIYSFAFFTRSSIMGTGSFPEWGTFVSVPECERMGIRYSIILLHLVQVHSIFSLMFWKYTDMKTNVCLAQQEIVKYFTNTRWDFNDVCKIQNARSILCKPKAEHVSSHYKPFFHLVNSFTFSIRRLTLTDLGWLKRKPKINLFGN